MKHLPVARKGHDALARTIGHPFDFLRGMNDLFEGILKDFEKFRLPSMENFWRETGVIAPKFDISEAIDAYNVKAELPGLEEKDIDLSVDRGVLVLKGEKKHERAGKGKNYFLSERSSYRYYQEIKMPWGVDIDKVKASFKKGVLEVTLPKIEKAKMERRRVEITSE